jgi:exopolysaccharide biosynthesis protein
MVLLVEVKTSAAKGVLAIGKDPARLSVRPSAGLGEYGETVGTIADRHDGVLAVTGGAFHGANDAFPGSVLAGYAMCNGTEYGNEHLPEGNKRIELHENNLLYITDSTAPVDARCTDAAEFRPALIIDGELLVEKGWAGMQPRVCLGQSSRSEILILVMEGRILSDGIIGASVLECATILQRHHAMQAMNLDGGNSAILWYNGQYLTRCCDADYPEGRPVPTAVIYG